MFRRGRSGHSFSIEADDRDVVELAVARRLVVEEVDASVARCRAAKVSSPIQRRTAAARSSMSTSDRGAARGRRPGRRRIVEQRRARARSRSANGSSSSSGADSAVSRNAEQRRRAGATPAPARAAATARAPRATAASSAAASRRHRATPRRIASSRSQPAEIARRSSARFERADRARETPCRSRDPPQRRCGDREQRDERVAREPRLDSSRIRSRVATIGSPRAAAHRTR